jgi:IQ calmodulin-binding motif
LIAKELIIIFLLITYTQADREREVVEERGNEAADIVSIEHFPVETSPDVTNDGMAAAADHDEEVEQRERRAVVAAAAEAALVAADATSRMIRMVAYERAMAASREDTAAVRIQAFFRGYLVMFLLILENSVIHIFFFFFIGIFLWWNEVFYLKKKEFTMMVRSFVVKNDRQDLLIGRL